MPTQPQVTRLLLDIESGDKSAFEELVVVLYDDLRMLARRQLRIRGNMVTLHTSGLVHEAYLKLVDQTQLAWNDRGHFLAVYARVMHNILIDMARHNRAAKRGGQQVQVTMRDHYAVINAQADELLAVDSALVQLAQLDEQLAQVVECRFFAGLTEEETALALQVSDRTVRRYWIKARTILHGMLGEDAGKADPA